MREKGRGDLTKRGRGRGDLEEIRLLELSSIEAMCSRMERERERERECVCVCVCSNELKGS